MSEALFEVGEILATPGAMRALTRAGQDLRTFLSRHVAGDWGEVPEEDKRANCEALSISGDVQSSYRTRLGETIWIVTNADRKSTVILLPEEY